MKQYHELLTKIIKEGEYKPDRTGTGTISLFGETMRFKLNEGFPLLTTKKIHFKSVVHELLWFLKGDTNIKYLNDNEVTIWNEWADANGDLGPIYGKQWRSWDTRDDNTIDQLTNVISELKANPNSRRLLVSSWNVGELDQMALPPCHVMFQFYVINNALSCSVYQRSADIFLGVPFNIASYALLTYMVAHQCNKTVGDLVWVGGDVHLYMNHTEQANTQLQREPRKLPFLNFKRKPDNLYDYKYEDFVLVNYDPHPAIKAEAAV